MVERCIEKTFKGQKNIWWDDITTPKKETIEDILKQAFSNVITTGKQQFGEDLSRWKWGKIHTISYTNATLGKSGISLIEKLFNRGPYPINGSIQTVNSSDWLLTNMADTMMYVSNRMIIDLHDFEKSKMINASGQSGHTGHPNYDDSISLWLDHEYHTNLWEKKNIVKKTENTLKLHSHSQDM